MLGKHRFPIYYGGEGQRMELNLKTNTSSGDKVAQLVRCRIGNQRVAGSNPGRLGHFGLFLGNIVYPILLQSTQLYNGYLA